MPSNPIDKAKKKALEALQSRISGMSSAAYAILLEAIEKTFDIKAGKIVVDKSFIKQLNRLTVSVLDLLQSEPKFTGPVSQFVKRVHAISEVTADFQKSTNDIKTPSFADLTKVINDEIIDKMLDNGLNQNFAQPLRDLIYRNATAGISLKDARIAIKEMAVGDASKLSKYLEQTAQQAADSYSGMINKKLLDTFDYDGLLITGSLIDNSSPQCVYAIEELGGKIARKDWPKLKEIAEKNGLIEKTTFDNLPVNRLHWGCRHSFYPIIIKKQAA
jgi:hypothetical protein